MALFASCTTQRWRDKDQMARTYRKHPKRKRAGTIKTKSKPALDWEARYSAQWRYGDIQRIAHKQTKNTCCYCMARRSKEVHHARYQDGMGKVRTHEIAAIGKSLFPVCLPYHRGKLHDRRAWHYDNDDPVFGSGNTNEVVERLRLGFKLLFEGIE